MCILKIAIKVFFSRNYSQFERQPKICVLLDTIPFNKGKTNAETKLDLVGELTSKEYKIAINWSQ